MKQGSASRFGSTIEAFIYPFLLITLMWSIYLVEGFYPDDFIRLGILPRETEGLKGILFSPLIHSPSDVTHLVNNSLPAAVLFGALIYFYRDIAARVFFFSWLLTGFAVWAFAPQHNSYHIGFSGIIYALAAFLFTSGTLRKYRPLQGISLFVVFIYGSMIWGVFPMEERVSWEAHLSGLVIGVTLAFVYRRKGPQAPKYQFEIEREMGIEPPDLEGIWNENMRLAREAEEERKRQQETLQNRQDLHIFFGEQPQVKYDYKPKEKGDEEREKEG